MKYIGIECMKRKKTEENIVNLTRDKERLVGINQQT